MSQTSAYFPLATDDSWQGQSGSITAQDGTDAGAAGDSSANSITLSTGALVAIIIVVVVVILIGSKQNPQSLSTVSSQHANTL